MKTILLITANGITLSDEALSAVRESFIEQAKEGVVITDDRFRVNLINVDLNVEEE